MIHIGICDDNEKTREKLKETLENMLFKYDECSFELYDSGERMMASIEAGEFDAELLLLDIHMDQVDGIEVARWIRENQIDVDIIFVTVSEDHVFDGYQFKAFSYLLKPLKKQRLQEEITRYMRERKEQPGCLHVTIGGRKEQVFLDRVYYFSADKRKIIIHERGDEERSFYAKMDELEEMLKEYDFVRCHQSYLVNKRYVKSATRMEIALSDEVIPVSRKYADDVKNAFGG